MEKRVVIFKGRGAIVSNWMELMKLVPGSVSLPVNMVHDVKLYKFHVETKGLKPEIWAKFWLKKGDNRARRLAGIHVPCPHSKKKETYMTKKQAERLFKSEAGCHEKSLKKKIRSCGWVYNLHS